MKRILLFCLMFVLAGCSSKSVKQDPSTSMANPWVEYSSLESALAHVSFDVKVPDQKDANYLVMDDALFEMQYDDISLRKEIGLDDISGDYNEYKDIQDIDISGIHVTCKSNEDLIHCAIWYWNEYAYSMTSEKGVNLDSLKSIVLSFV